MTRNQAQSGHRLRSGGRTLYHTTKNSFQRSGRCYLRLSSGTVSGAVWEMSGIMTVDTVSCPLCGGQSGFALTKDEYNIYRCGVCDFLFVHPYPTLEEIKSYYSSNYRGASEDYYPKLNSRKRRAFVKSLRFFRYVYRKRVLDTGCGGGIMADAFRRLGADSHGMDVSDNSIKFAKKNFSRCTFYCEDFETMARRGLQFDFMFTSEVMEHLAGPHACLRFIAASSKPGTVIYVATPDSAHIAVPSDISNWTDICPPEHLQWFNQDNIERLFNNYGFKLIKSFPKKTPALSLLFRKQS